MENRKRKFADIPELDRKIIDGIPWANKMFSILESGLEKTVLYWCKTVLNMGESDEVLNEWVSIFLETYEDTCCNLVSDMEYMHGKLVDKIEQLLQKVQQSCITLQIEMPVCGNKQLSLCEERRQLEEKIEEYEKIINVRVGEADKLRKKQLTLCHALGREPRYLKDSPLPSFEEIDELQKHVEKLESEKFSRLEMFISTKEELQQIVTELKMPLSSNFERDVFSADDSAFKVTDDNMTKLEQLRRNLHKKQKDVKEETGELRSKIDDLWNMLEVDLKEREAFRKKHIGVSIEVLEALRSELKRCEELKRANIKEFIIKLRNELEDIWNKCHCSESMKRDFGFFYSDCYNEDLLELHEVEKAKWKKHYEENKKLILLLEKHRELWKKMIELEENDAAPDRFNNRGGQLLKEERERNKLSKQIPQLEDSLKNLAELYQNHYGRPFTTFGETIHDYILSLHEERDTAKKLKLSARKQYKEQTMLTPAKSAISLFPSTSQLRIGTPLSNTKRKLATPINDNKKKARLVQSEVKSIKAKRTPVMVPAIKVTNASGMKRVSIERKKRIQRIRRLSAQKSRHDETLPTTDYGEFQIGLSNKEGSSRSTFMPSEMLPAATPTSRKLLNFPTTGLRPNTPRTPKTPRTLSALHKTPEAGKLSRAKSNLKLIF